MKRKIIPILFIMLLFMPFMVFSFETLTTVYVDGSAPMTIDGKLDDWEIINTSEVQITQPILKTRSTANIVSLTGNEDLSFSFKCFADSRYVYFALIVKDNEVIIGTHDFGKGWLDDSTTIYFDGDCQNIDKQYFDANDGQLKVIGNPPDGVKYIEGLIPYFYEVQVPYFWETRGVKGGFQLTDDGYITEVAIPISMLGWDKMYLGKQMGVNIRVVDMDSDVNPDDVDKGFIWAPDPDHTSHFMTKTYNRIVFSEEGTIPGSSTQGAHIVNGEGRVIELVLGSPDFSSVESLLNSVLADIADEDFSNAEAKLATVNGGMWVQPLLGIIQLKAEKLEQGMKLLLEVAENYPDDYAVKWVRNFLKYDSQFLYDTFSGRKITDNHKFANIAYILNKYLKQYSDDEEAYSELYSVLERTGGEEIDFVILNKVISETEKQEILNKAKLSLARYYFFNSDYDNSARLAEELINSGVDSKTALSSHMILLSIEQKKSY